MTAGEIVLIIVKTVLGVIAFVVTFMLFMYFERPYYTGKPGYPAYFLRGMGLFLICVALSALNVMALAGVFGLTIFLFLIPVSVYAVLFTLALKICARVRGGPRPDYAESKREESKASDGFIDGLAAARREYSDYCVARYHMYKEDHPNAKHSAKLLALQAVKKDKRNPEAQVDSYLNGHLIAGLVFLACSGILHTKKLHSRLSDVRVKYDYYSVIMNSPGLPNAMSCCCLT